MKHPRLRDRLLFVLVVVVWEMFCFSMIALGLVMPTKERRQKMKQLLEAVKQSYLLEFNEMRREFFPLVAYVLKEWFKFGALLFVIPFVVTPLAYVVLSGFYPAFPSWFVFSGAFAASIMASVSLCIGTAFWWHPSLPEPKQ